MKFLKYIFAVAIACAAASCTNDKWQIKGDIQNVPTDGTTILLQSAAGDGWTTLDTIKVNAKGHFDIKHKAPGFPNIYRLNLADRYIYFPIDSLETLTINADAANFDSEYTISGSSAAESMQAIDLGIINRLKSESAADILADSVFKRSIIDTILADPAGVVSYYLVNKRVQGLPVFDINEKLDLKIIGAVANAYTQKRPADPRTDYLKSLYLSNRATLPTNAISAPEIPLIDINLMDESGKTRILSDVAGSNRVVLVNFTTFGGDFSPSFNVILNDLYQKYHASGLEIYQISFDVDEYAWRQAAKNIPWITVYNSEAEGLEYVQKYNVSILPTSFIVVNGELRKRIDNPSDTEKIVASYM